MMSSNPNLSSGAPKRRYYFGRWNGKVAKVERPPTMSSENDETTAFSSVSSSSVVSKCSELFDSAMEDSSPEKDLIRPTMFSRSNLPICHIGESGLKYSSYNGGSSTGRSNQQTTTQKWGETSRTRNQIRLDESKSNGDTHCSRQPSVEAAIDRPQEFKLSGTRDDRFALSSDEETFEPSKIATSSTDRRQVARYAKQMTKNDNIEMNFLGEPVDTLSIQKQESTYVSEPKLLGNDRNSKSRSNKVLSLTSYITANQQNNANILNPNNALYRSVDASSQECTKQTAKTVGFIGDLSSHPEVSASSSKMTSNFSNSHFDSDYFSQSQSPRDNTSPSTQNVTLKSSNNVNTATKTQLEPVPLKSTISEPTIRLTEPAPLSQKDKKTNFLSKQGSTSRKSPLKARYNARAWVSSEEENDNNSKVTTASSISSNEGRTNGNAQQQQQAPANNYGATGQSFQLSKDPYGSGDFDDEDEDETTVCQTLPKSVRFKGLTRQSTAPPSCVSSTQSRPTGVQNKQSMFGTQSALDRFDESQFLDDELTQPKESVKVSRKEKELYTVVRSVKRMQESLEDGESQKFKEDMQYLLEGVAPAGSGSLSTRCLSLTSMAQKALQPHFRVQFRAHAVLPKLCFLVTDAPKYESLALTTAAMLYVLSRDKIPLDLNIYSLALVVRLIKENFGTVGRSDDGTKSVVAMREKKEVIKWRFKVKKLLESLADSASVLLLSQSTEFSASDLALEVLLSVFSTKTKWSTEFQTQFLKCGAVDYVAKAYIVSAEVLTRKPMSELRGEEEKDFLKLHLKKLLRCSTLIENATYNHQENQKSIIVNEDIPILPAAAKVFRYLVNAVQFEFQSSSSFCSSSSSSATSSVGYVDSSLTSSEEDETTSSVVEIFPDGASQPLPVSTRRCRSRNRVNEQSKSGDNYANEAPKTADSKYKLKSDSSVGSSDGDTASQDAHSHDEMHESLQECLIDGLGICLNLTNDSELGSTKLGNQPDMLPCLIECVLHTPKIVTDDKKFDVTVMSLGLLINLLDCSPLNRRQFLMEKTHMPQFNITSLNSPPPPVNKVVGRGVKKTVSAVEAFVHLFVTHEKQAQKIEQEEKLDDSATDDEEANPSGNNKSGKGEGKVNEVGVVGGTEESVNSDGGLSPRRSRRRKQLANGGDEMDLTSLCNGGDDMISTQQQQQQQQQHQHKCNGGGEGEKQQRTLDDEFVDDGEGGMIWVGRTANTGLSSDESILGPKEREKREEEERNNVLEQALCAAGRHMESCMIASYISLLIACILQGNMNNMRTVLQFVPSGNFASMIGQLERFHKFMGLTTAVNGKLLESISTHITLLKEADQKIKTNDLLEVDDLK